MNTAAMISVPIAVNNNHFRMQLELFWFNHKATYGESAAREKLRAVIVRRNTVGEQPKDICEWAGDIPHVMADAFFDVRKDLTNPVLCPINIQLGLSQVIAAFEDEQVIEVLDCDMFHLKPHPDLTVAEDELIVADIYEEWHLKSLTDHKNVIEPFFKNGGNYYNGGFVPIIGKAKTFRKILPVWIELHKLIVEAQPGERNGGPACIRLGRLRTMPFGWAMDLCYVPHQRTNDATIAHYSVDHKFNRTPGPISTSAASKRTNSTLACSTGCGRRKCWTRVRCCAYELLSGPLRWCRHLHAACCQLGKISNALGNATRVVGPG